MKLHIFDDVDVAAAEQTKTTTKGGWGGGGSKVFVFKSSIAI